jgi:hypothetical protein
VHAQLAADYAIEHTYTPPDPPELRVAHDIAPWANGRPTVSVVSYNDMIHVRGKAETWMTRWEAKCIVEPSTR